jgi:hypothetical protein
MKAVSSLTILIITALPAINLIAQEAENSIVDSTDDSNAYLEEIKTACQLEAEGLPDANEYVKNCIEIMKASFSQ